MLTGLYIGHLGIVKMKEMSRSFYYRKNIDLDRKKNETKRNIYWFTSNACPWGTPEVPCRIRIHFAGPCLGNNQAKLLELYNYFK